MRVERIPIQSLETFPRWKWRVSNLRPHAAHSTNEAVTKMKRKFYNEAIVETKLKRLPFLIQWQTCTDHLHMFVCPFSQLMKVLVILKYLNIMCHIFKCVYNLSRDQFTEDELSYLILFSKVCSLISEFIYL